MHQKPIKRNFQNARRMSKQSLEITIIEKIFVTFIRRSKLWSVTLMPLETTNFIITFWHTVIKGETLDEKLFMNYIIPKTEVKDHNM